MFLTFTQRATIQEDWITILFLIILAILVGINYLYRDKLAQTCSSFTHPVKTQQKRIDCSVFFNTYHFLLFILQVLIITLMCYIGYNYFNSNNNEYKGLSLFGIFLALIFSYYIFYYLIVFILKEIFDVNTVFESYFHNKFNYLSVVLIALIPFILIAIYSSLSPSILFKGILFITIVLFIWRAYLISVNNKNLIFSKLFYFILYLCTLEIAPVLVLWKLINKN